MANKLELYEDEHGDQPVLRWLREDLTPVKRRAIGVGMREALAAMGPPGRLRRVPRSEGPTPAARDRNSSRAIAEIAQSEISRIERGAANPTVATLAALSEPLGARLQLTARAENVEKLSVV